MEFLDNFDKKHILDSHDKNDFVRKFAKSEPT